MVNAYVQQLKAFWNWMVRHDAVKDNPWTKFRMLAESPEPAKCFNQKILETLKNYLLVNDRQLWTIGMIMMYSMVRPKEIRMLKVKDVNVYEGDITVSGKISKNNRQRVPVMPEVLCEYLARELEITKYDPEDFLISLSGEPGPIPVGKNYMWNHWDAVRKALRLPQEYKLYSFKHTGNKFALKAGVSLKVLQMQNGHQNLNQTNTYVSQFSAHDDEAYKKFKIEI
jgi:integrase